MKPPVDSIDILGLDWHLIGVEALTTTDEVYGLCEVGETRIKYCLDPDVNPSMMKITILHEIIHAISESLTLGVDDEVQVQSLAHALYTMFDKNEEFRKWFFAEK